jgi:hypothetical protein
MTIRYLSGLLLLLFWATVSYSEQQTTENLLEEYTDTNINVVGNPYGMSGAEITTGNQSQGGGTRTYDIDLSEYENLEQIEYGSTVYSHISNDRVPACANTTSDCRDDFSITLKLYNDNELQETYANVYEGITWTGNQIFEYSQDVSELTFNTAELELYGIDRGYYSGYYGVGFSDTYLKAQYNPLDIVTDLILDVVEDISLDVDTSFTVVIEDTFFEPIEIEIEMIDIMVEPTIELELPELEMIEEIPELEIVEVEMQEIEAEIEQLEAEVQEVEVDVQEVKQQVAEKIMAKFEDKMSVESQTIALGLMVALSNTTYDYTEQTITETIAFEDTAFIIDNIAIQETNSNLYGYMDYFKMNEMIDQQWQN